MVEYTAKDGLHVLNYLSILNLTEQEREVFKEKWDEFYNSHDKDLIQTVWVLYAETLPFTCGDRNRGSFVVAHLRDIDFGKRLDESNLNEKLEEGKSLSKIFSDSPERFFKLN